MSFLDKIEKVIREAGTPLRSIDITQRLLLSGAWTTTGKTPAATVHARIAEDIKYNPESRFIRTGKGVFAVRPSSPIVSAAAAATGSSGIVKPKRSRTAQLSFLDAAERILEEYGAKRPMHYRDITAKALELGLVSTTGKTPEATLYAQILTENDRRERRGERPRFVKHGRGFVGLTRWNAQGLTFQIERHNDGVRKELHQRIRDIAPPEFEALIGKLLTKLGFEDVEVTARSGDGGIDVRGTMVTADVIRTRMAVQVKRWKANVQAPTVQQVRGSLGTHEQGLIITTSTFSAGARAEAERSNTTPVALMDGEQLVKLLVENEIGVKRGSQLLLELAAEDE